MTPTVRFPLMIAALLAVAACGGPAVSGPAATVPVPADAPTPPETIAAPAEETAMTCQADKGQWAIGQIADEALVAKVKADTTSESVRVIKPDMMVTMDYREDRVNLDVDADNRVTAVRCT
ncbi:MAG: hypothetical protein K0M70_14075 [Arenimonas sp.]|uniref:I78 family peptidase inhibitor n=1 Tax=Arenimonas sp. TaxID=1872635 RepID=UPI0025BE9EB7|nr:I78 family peptidase inhibitor [Arenimonas sp.]MBW8368970.1 hypothetical protein [Arenimonas sp.]